MSDWQNLESLVRDGRHVEFLRRDGQTYRAPASMPVELTRKQRVEMVKVAGWPNIKFNPTHWRELNSGPK